MILLKKTNYNTKINELENKIPDISNLATKTTLTTVENKISSSHVNDPTLKNCLFGGVTLTKNPDIDKYGYSGYGIGFHRRGCFSFPSGGYVLNVLIFGVDMSFSTHLIIRKKTY